jgi:hypothetical protein
MVKHAIPEFLNNYTVQFPKPIFGWALICQQILVDIKPKRIYTSKSGPIKATKYAP